MNRQGAVRQPTRYVRMLNEDIKVRAHTYINIRIYIYIYTNCLWGSVG